jgi:prenyltransferase beta subunit
MLQVARLSPRVLGESSELVAAFLRQQLTAAGGFSDRAGAPDLYYTVFGLEGLIAVHHDPLSPATRSYLQTFGDGEGLDFVHLCCLARAWATITRAATGVPVSALAARIESFRSSDGGYNATPHASSGTAYAVFLALGAYQDLRVDLPDVHRLLRSLATLRSLDGAYGNQPQLPRGQTSATAAAIAVHCQLGETPDEALGDWLLARVHSQGGFTAGPDAPIPDLLSTATALHALATLQRPLDDVRDLCLDFVDTLWTNRGGFYGHWADEHVACEYTYYGLLALGHLSA